MFPLIPFAELAPPRVGGVGRAPTVYRDRDRVAVCSEFPLLYWPGRAVYEGHSPRYRVALHVTDAPQPIAYFDAARFPIQDVAFHPHEPVLAIAVGSYDGGYFFEGELWWWNWRTGERRSLLGESRMVERCRFDGDQIAILLLPPNDDEWDPQARFTTGIDPHAVRPVEDAGTDPRLHDLTPADLSAAGFGEPWATPDPQELARLGIVPRATVWDLVVLADGRIVVAFGDGVLEVFRTSGERVLRKELGGRVVQLLRQPDQVIVNVTRYMQAEGREQTTLYALRGDELVDWHGFSTGRACSVDAAGRLLARNTDRDPVADVVLAPDHTVVLEQVLGHYDCFNHYLRIDGAADLYFLRGEPKHQHRAKVLCRIDDRGAVHDVMPWDPPGGHLMITSGILVCGDLVRAYRTYAPGPSLNWIERLTLTGELAWQHELPATTIALMSWPAAGAIVFALVDCTLGIVDAETGELLRLEPFVLDGLPTIVTTLAVHDETLITGTIDGRIVMYAMR